MQLEDYFDFNGPGDIRVKGHRIGIEHVLYESIHRAATPEEIVGRYPTLSLEEVYATLLYFERNKQSLERYVADWLEWGAEQRRKQAEDPSLDPLRERLAKVRDQVMLAHK